MEKRMFLITFHAKPNKTSDDYENIRGAHVNCWIEAELSEHAELIARKEIENYNWRVKTLDEIIEVDNNFYNDDDEKKEYFEQALIDKIVLLFYTYPRKKK